MAACSSDSESSELDRLLECPVCYEHLHVPKLLNCGHCVCDECLTRMPKANKKVECPVCRVKSAMTNHGLPTVYAIQSLVEMLTKNKENFSSLKCVTCDSKCSSKDAVLCLPCHNDGLQRTERETEERCNPNFKYETLSLIERLRQQKPDKAELLNSLDTSLVDGRKSANSSPSVSEDPEVDEWALDDELPPGPSREESVQPVLETSASGRSSRKRKPAQTRASKSPNKRHKGRKSRRIPDITLD